MKSTIDWVAATAFMLTGGAILATPTTAQTATPSSTDQSTSEQSAAGQAPAGQSSAETGGSTEGIADIIVTAQRRSENSQRAAVALNVIQGNALLASGITQVDGLNKLAPALTIQQTNTGNSVFVRGVGNFALTLTSDPAIAFNYDNVYVGRPTATTGVFYDLDRVEILKGPQGTLYGRNATGGAINVLPTQPVVGELSGYVSATYGNYNTINAEGAINVPFGDKGAARLSLSRSSHDGYLSDGTSDEDTWAGRFQIKAELTPDLTVRVAGDYAHNGGLGAGLDYQGIYLGSAANFVSSGIPLGTGLITPRSQAFRTGTIFGALGNHLPPLAQQFVDNTFYGANADIEYKMGAGTLTVIPAWRNAKLNYLANAGAIPYRSLEKDNQYSFEARFAGTRIGPFDYQIGGYYFDESLGSTNELTTANVANYQRPRLKTKSYAGFGRLILNVNDRLRLVGGLRYTKDDKTFSTIQLTSIIQCVVFVMGRPSCPNAPTAPLFNDPSQLGYAFPSAPGAVPIFVGGVPTGALSIRADTVYDNVPLHNSKLTYRGAVEFDVAPRSLLYASVESGYRSGGFSVATGFETYQPETITAYTIGAKNRFFNNKLQVNVEGFLWDYNNQQVSHIALDLGGRTANYTQNIGSSRIKGIEVDGKLLITPTTLVGADVQYLDAKQRHFTYLAGAGFPPIVGCPVSNIGGASPYLIDCSGLPAYNSPKWTINLSGQQTIRLDSYKIVLTADTQYRSSRYIGFGYLPQMLIRSTWTTNAEIQLSPNSNRWSVSAYVRNIENDRIPFYSAESSENFLVANTTAPRTYGLRLSAKY